MEILGKAVSDTAAKAIEQIEQALHKPIRYNFTDPQKTESFGQCDPWHPDAYYVYSKQSLLNIAKQKDVNVPFETNILHELFHLCQLEEGFPYTSTCDNSRTASTPDLFDRLGSLIVSCVLDLNVDYRLKQIGYTSEYFYKHRLNRAEKLFRKGYVCDDEINFVQYACMLINLKLSYDTPAVDDLLSFMKIKNGSIVACVEDLSQGISEIEYQDSDTAFGSLVFLFSAFNLWSTHLITYKNKPYRSTVEVQADYPGIRIWARRHVSC